MPGTWRRYVAIGDSFTEGVGDPDPVTGVERGWADRLAAILAREAAGRFEYANLAIRGTLLDRIVETQLSAALTLEPDLVTFCAAGNDLLHPGARPDALAGRLDAAVVRLRASGADVVLFTGFDTRATPVLSLVSRRLAAMNDHIRAIAEHRGAYIADLWTMAPLADPRARDDDRLHLNADGHARVADRVAEVLGVAPEGDWRRPWPPAPPESRRDRLGDEARWARTYLWPWVQRRVRGRSTGDGRRPKRPQPTPLG